MHIKCRLCLSLICLNAKNCPETFPKKENWSAKGIFNTPIPNKKKANRRFSWEMLHWSFDSICMKAIYYFFFSPLLLFSVQFLCVSFKLIFVGLFFCIWHICDHSLDIYGSKNVFLGICLVWGLESCYDKVMKCLLLVLWGFCTQNRM